MSGSTSYRVGVRIDGSAAGLARAAREGETALRVLGTNGMAEYRRMSQARELLGVRSEREIQREMQRTQAAYNRLARSGTASFGEQRRAAAKMREELTRLTNEMGKYTTAQKAAFGLKAAGAVGAGLGVTGSLLRPKVEKALSYDTRLSRLANTGYSEKDDAGWREGRSFINTMIEDAVRKSGVTREEAMSTAETLYAAGGLKPEEIKTLLHSSSRAAMATGGEANDFANLAMKARKTMGIPVEQAERLFGIGSYAGKMGQFEIKDMAKHLPAQMGAAQKVGIYGEQGFAKLAALNQAAINTAGTRDEAGTNVKNLLEKIGSKDTQKDFKGIGVDLPKALAEGRMQGRDAIDVVGDQIEKLLSKDKNYQQAQKLLALSKNDEERAANLRAVGDIAQGTVVGKVFQDQQALSALVAYMNTRKETSQIAADSVTNAGAMGTDYRRMSGTGGFKWQSAANEKELAQQAAMDKLTPAIGGVSDGMAGLMREFPGMTGAALLAKDALMGLATTAGLLMLLTGGKLPSLVRGRAPGAAAPTAPGAPGAPGGPAAGAAKGIGGRALALLGKAGPLMGAASVLAGLFYTSDEEIAVLKAAERRAGKGGATGSRAEGEWKAPDTSPAARAAPGPLPPQSKGGATGSRAEGEWKAPDTSPAARAALGPLPPEIANLPAPELARVLGRRMKDKDVMAQLAAPYVERGYRGAGFDDPRLLTRPGRSVAEGLMQTGAQAGQAPLSLQERMGQGAASASQQVRQEAMKGEILVRVTGAPGLNVEAETKSKTPSSLVFRTDVGRTMLGTGA